MAFQEGFNPFGGISKSSDSGSSEGGGDGAGGGVMYVTVTGEDGTEVQADKTQEEIITALDSGIQVIIKTNDMDEIPNYLPLISYARYGDNNEYYQVLWSFTDASSSGSTIEGISRIVVTMNHDDFIGDGFSLYHAWRSFV